MDDNYNTENFIQVNSPDGGFLQSEEWRKFQESVGRKTFHIEHEGFWVNIIEHQLSVVGKYFYVPRGPIIGLDSQVSSGMTNITDLAKKENVGWIRIEPATEKILDLIKKSSDYKVAKAPHDMQPKEVFVIDITKSEEELLAGMKQKTRYNIKLSKKHGVSVKAMTNAKCQMTNQNQNPNDKNYKFYIDEFVRLVKITAKRDKITPHPENYYRKMFEVIPGDILKLYVAEYSGEIIAANLMIFFGNTAIYLHGASDDKFRNAMAPYSLQWQVIRDAKIAGCKKYDLGGIHTKTGEGITKFKLGFAPNTKPVEFPGSYDIVLSPFRYYLYRIIQKLKGIL